MRFTSGRTRTMTFIASADTSEQAIRYAQDALVCLNAEINFLPFLERAVITEIYAAQRSISATIASFCASPVSCC